MSLSKARANEVGRTPTTNDILLIQVTCNMNAKAKHKTKIYEHQQGPMKGAHFN